MCQYVNFAIIFVWISRVNLNELTSSAVKAIDNDTNLLSKLKSKSIRNGVGTITEQMSLQNQANQGDKNSLELEFLPLHVHIPTGLPTRTKTYVFVLCRSYRPTDGGTDQQTDTLSYKDLV